MIQVKKNDIVEMAEKKIADQATQERKKKLETVFALPEYDFLEDFSSSDYEVDYLETDTGLSQNKLKR